MRHVTHMNASCHAYEWVMPDIWMSHVHIWISHIAYTSHVTHMHESCRTCEWVLSHVWMSHVTRVNESCNTCEWVMSHIWRSHTREWIITHTSLWQIQPIPLGVTFSKAQSSELERLFCHVSVKRNVRDLSCELWNSIRKCHPKWDWLYIRIYNSKWLIHLYMTWIMPGHEWAICSFTSCEWSICSCVCTDVQQQMCCDLLLDMNELCAHVYTDIQQQMCWHLCHRRHSTFAE